MKYLILITALATAGTAQPFPGNQRAALRGPSDYPPSGSNPYETASSVAAQIASGGVAPYTSTPAAVSTAGSAGSSANFARGDHVHAIPAGLITATQISATAAIMGSQLSASAAIADGQLAISYTKSDGSRPFSGNQSMGSHKLTDLSVGTADTDAVNKGQMDAAITTASTTTTAATNSMGSEHIAGINAVCTNSSTINITLTGAILADDSKVVYNAGTVTLVGTGTSNVTTDDAAAFVSNTWYARFVESDGAGTTYIRWSKVATKPANCLRFYAFCGADFNNSSGAAATFRTSVQCNWEVYYWYNIRYLSAGHATSYTSVGTTNNTWPTSIGGVRRAGAGRVWAYITGSGYESLAVRPSGGESSGSYGQDPIWIDTSANNNALITSIALAENTPDLQYICNASGATAYVDIGGFTLIPGRLP